MIENRTDNSAYGKNKDSITYWGNNRNSLEDLYPSEKKYFINAINECMSVLDIGCAAGGFSKIVNEINPRAMYTGIDLSHNLINLAKEIHPDEKFYLYDGVNFPDVLDKYDLVYSFGVLHHVDNWSKIVTQMLSCTKSKVIFDLRLTNEKTINDIEKSYQKIAFDNKWDGQTKISYNVINIGEVIRELVMISDDECRIDIYGYNASPTELAVTKYKTVTMASICIELDSEKPGFYCNIKY